jgi:hypothetical protein
MKSVLVLLLASAGILAQLAPPAHGVHPDSGAAEPRAQLAPPVHGVHPDSGAAEPRLVTYSLTFRSKKTILQTIWENLIKFVS